MPRHSFSFPLEVRNSVINYTRRKVMALNPMRFNQEPLYYSALIHSLEGVVYNGTHGTIRFEATAFDDRGPKSTESLLGADFAITATVEDAQLRVRKAILFQAKKGYINDMNAKEAKALYKQIELMKKFTRSPKIIELTSHGGSGRVTVLSGTKIVQRQNYKRVDLSHYIVRRVLTTLDGDTRPRFVDLVQQSKIPTLRIEAFLERPKDLSDQQLKLDFN